MNRRPPDDDDDAFDAITRSLEAVVSTNEMAAETIIAALERNADAVEALRALADTPEAKALLDAIAENGTRALEACAFDDLNGQRIAQVRRTLDGLKARIGDVSSPETGDGEPRLEGPGPEGGGLSQKEIDKAFD